MARKKQFTVTEDPTVQIEDTKKTIEELTAQLKNERAKLKKLEKQKEAYQAYQEHLKEEQMKNEIVQMVVNSGKSLEEIRELLLK